MQNYHCQTSEYMRYPNNRRSAPSSCCKPEGKEDCRPKSPVLAMAYVSCQEWRNILSAEKGFCHGTIFEELNKPFRGTGGDRR